LSWREEYARSIDPARALAAETLKLERSLSDLVNQTYGLTPFPWKDASRDRGQSLFARMDRLAGSRRICWSKRGRSR